MALVPYKSFRQLANMMKDFDRFFSDFPFTFESDQNFGGIRVDVHEAENDVVATCDVPGLEKKEDVNIEIENNVLRVSGSINRTNEIKEEDMHRKNDMLEVFIDQSYFLVLYLMKVLKFL